MKIVFLSHDSNCIGGAQMCLVDLIKGIKAENPSIQIYLLLNSYGDMVTTCEQYIDGYEVIPMRWWMYEKKQGSNQLHKNIKYIVRQKIASLKIANYLRKIKPDFGLSNSIVLPQLAMACKSLSINHIWFLHEIPMLTWSNSRFIYSTKKILKIIDRLSMKIIVPSEFSRSFYRQHINGDKIHTLNQAVNINSHTRNNIQRYTLLMVGALEQNKGQIEILQAIKKITDTNKDIFCYLVGHSNNNYANECKEYIEHNKLEKHIKIVDFTLDTSQYYCKSNVLVNCSTMESFGRVAVEAQLCGMPVILSSVGANSERIMDGINGLLYKKGDVNDLVEKIELLRDPVRREQFSRNISLLGLEKHTTAEFARGFLGFLQ